MNMQLDGTQRFGSIQACIARCARPLLEYEVYQLNRLNYMDVKSLYQIQVRL